MKIYRTLPIKTNIDIAEALRAQIHVLMDIVIAHPDATPDDANNATYLKRSTDMDRSTMPIDVVITDAHVIDARKKIYDLIIDDHVLENLPDTPLSRFWTRANELYDSVLTKTETEA